MDAELTTDQLISRVRDATKDLTFNGRIDAQISERTLRYYTTMKYLAPPVRINGRAMWTEKHVNELIHIRRAQSAGKSLKEIGESLTTDLATPWRSANRGALRSQMIDVKQMKRDVEELSARLHTRQTPKGWSFRISKDITLNGFTIFPPTEEEIRNVIAALSRIIPE